MPPRWSLDSSSSHIGPSSDMDEDDLSFNSSSSLMSSPAPTAVASNSSSSTDDEESRDPAPHVEEDSSKTNVKKSVQFSDFASLHLYYRPGSEELESPSSSTWYSRSELKSFRMDTLQTVERILSGDTQDDLIQNWDAGSFVFCPRGCEGRTPMGTVLRHKHHEDSMRALFQCQDEMRRRRRRHRQKHQHHNKDQCRYDDDDESEPNHRRRSHCDSKTTFDDEDTIALEEMERMARVYGEYTQQSLRMAQVMGQIDESNVQRDIAAENAPNGRPPVVVVPGFSNTGTLDCSKLEQQQHQQPRREKQNLEQPQHVHHRRSRSFLMMRGMRYHLGAMSLTSPPSSCK
mmetsp:Transcript_17257/g.31088  ORF Transcript_17257/g.31088 Transcript_17257/m.31088 type:complete len:345 (+) Transcript_17257:332-1366(+)